MTDNIISSLKIIKNLVLHSYHMRGYYFYVKNEFRNFRQIIGSS